MQSQVICSKFYWRIKKRKRRLTLFDERDSLLMMLKQHHTTHTKEFQPKSSHSMYLLSIYMFLLLVVESQNFPNLFRNYINTRCKSSVRCLRFCSTTFYNVVIPEWLMRPTNDMIICVMTFQGYTKPREYIVTEWPLKHTVGEFWSLVYDQECSAVVVLLQPPPNSVSAKCI